MKSASQVILCLAIIALLVTVVSLPAAADTIRHTNEEELNLDSLITAGEALEEGGARLERSFYMSLGGSLLSGAGILVSAESPSLGLIMMLGGMGLSIWGTVEQWQGYQNLREAGEELKGSVYSW